MFKIDETDLLSGKVETPPRRRMPECWLEFLECEMVARSAKHVLDEYPIEESAADTENMLTQQGPDSDDSTPYSAHSIERRWRECTSQSEDMLKCMGRYHEGSWKNI